MKHLCYWNSIHTIVFSTMLISLIQDLTSLGFDSTCPKSNQFLCDNLRCIHTSWVCDGDDDCEDKSDERNCHNRTCDLNSYFRCPSGICLPLEYICDGQNDCKDNFDETNCANRTCPPHHFKCSNSSFNCLSDAFKCDRDRDCDDGSDEADCLPRDCNATSEFQCANGECIFKQWRCDNEDDCADASDEKHCPVRECTSSEFRCVSNKRCIPMSLRCDDDPDCDDRSDEIGCSQNSSSTLQLCPDGRLPCRSGDDRELQCISPFWFCDGDIDCPDGSDEHNCGLHSCSSDQFHCDLHRCINKSAVCDGNRDCNDESDEKSCPVAVCDLATSYLCSDNVTCIAKAELCDRKPNCPDADDEKTGPGQCFDDECKSNNGNCSDICVDEDPGYRCACPAGYQLDTDGLTCVDVNECRDEQIDCEQRCVNLKGGYKCSCYAGYDMDERGRCKLVDGNGSLLSLVFTNKRNIRRISLNRGRFNGHLTTLASDLSFAAGLALNVRKRLLYWTDVLKDRVYRLDLERERSSPRFEPETIVSGKGHLRTSFGVAVDWINDLLYWTDYSLRTISVSLPDGTWPTTIVSTKKRSPHAIALHPGKRFMFVVLTSRAHSAISRYDMNGKNRLDLVQSNIVQPSALALDFEEERLFWLDAKLHQLSSCDMDGRNRVDVLTSSRALLRPFGIALFHDKVYWSDRGSRKLQCCNKWSGLNLHTIAGHVDAPFALKIDHVFTQPHFPSSCGSHHCRFICLPTPHTALNFSCHCPNGYFSLNDDSSNCAEVNSFPDDPLQKQSETTSDPDVREETTQSKPSVSRTITDHEANTTTSSVTTLSTDPPTLPRVNGGKSKTLHVVAAVAGALFVLLLLPLTFCYRRDRPLLLKVRVESAIYWKAKRQSHDDDEHLLIDRRTSRADDDSSKEKVSSSDSESSGNSSECLYETLPTEIDDDSQHLLLHISSDQAT